MGREMHTTDVVVVGAGILGTAVAYGITQRDQSVALLDGGGRAQNASVGNFGLVWYTSCFGKGGNSNGPSTAVGTGSRAGSPYARWGYEACTNFGDFAERLREQSGLDVLFRHTGGMVLCHGAEEFNQRAETVAALAGDVGGGWNDVVMLKHDEAQKKVPDLRLGEKIYGASYCPHDGYVNPLFLLKAMQIAFQKAGGQYFTQNPACEIRPVGSSYEVKTPTATFSTGKVVLAAGLATTRLAEQFGIQAPTHAEKGILLVTERARRRLSMPLSGLQQSPDGTFIFGVSNEERGIDNEVSPKVVKQIAARAIERFPDLADLRVVRTWAGLRVVTPDVYPIFDQAEDYPGVFAMTAHCGVTLAPVNAVHLAGWVATGDKPEGFDFDCFSGRRFDV